MKFSTKHHQIALTLLSGIGSRRARTVLAHFADLEEFFTEKKLDISQIPSIPKGSISFQQRTDSLIEADRILTDLASCEGESIFFTDKNYPRKLKQCDDAPLLLYFKGNVNWQEQKTISIVGTRNMTSYGLDILHEFFEGVSDYRPTIVSGLAYGVDVMAHQLALKHDLSTWCVMGNGLNKVYPTVHKKTAFESLQTGGLISEFEPNQKAEAAHFPMRNRIVAGLSDATIVIESGISGGSLITANLARDYHREVYTFPGDIHRPYSKGCNKLIQENIASMITSSKDFIKQMEWKQEEISKSIQTKMFVDLSILEEKIINAFDAKREVSLDILAFKSQLPVSQVSSELLTMEFKGLIRSLPGRKYSMM